MADKVGKDFERARKAYPPPQEKQVLHVAADPAVQPAVVGYGVLRRFVGEGDVGRHQRGGVDALRHIVRKHAPVGDAVEHAGAEHVHRQQPLAAEHAAAEQVAVTVERSLLVERQPRAAADDRGEARLRGRLERGLHLRLDDAVARRHPAVFDVRTVLRVGDDRQQRADAAHRQVGVRVEREDVGRAACLVAADDGGKLVFALLDVAHQRADGAPLALEAVEHAVGAVFGALAQKQAEAAAVFFIQRVDFRLRLLDHARVGFQTRAFGVRQVAEDAEIQVRPAVGDAEALQPREQLVVRTGQQGGDDGERAVFFADIIHAVARNGPRAHKAVEHDVAHRVGAADQRRQQKQRPRRPQGAQHADRQQQPHDGQRVDVQPPRAAAAADVGAQRAVSLAQPQQREELADVFLPRVIVERAAVARDGRLVVIHIALLGRLEQPPRLPERKQRRAVVLAFHAQQVERVGQVRFGIGQPLSHIAADAPQLAQRQRAQQDRDEREELGGVDVALPAQIGQQLVLRAAEVVLEQKAVQQREQPVAVLFLQKAPNRLFRRAYVGIAALDEVKVVINPNAAALGHGGHRLDTRIGFFQLGK